MKSIPRRQALGLLGGLVASPALADRLSVAAAIDAVTGGAKATSSELVTLEIPEVAENGRAVNLRFVVDSPMTPEDHIKAVHVFAEGNPRPVVASFNFSPACGACEATTRMRLARSQTVTLLAEKGDGSFHMAEAEVAVTVGGCEN